ncbi:MAG: putative phosphate transport protein (TIGR00153 family) [Gammaproteobacteria bacterium]|jgi:predicted phosphate transport protein (TIGR00153 family)
MASNYFSKIFSHSPFKAMQEHMVIVNECVQLLSPFFNAVLKGDHSKAKAVYKEISKLENKADALKKKLRLQMPNGLFMPVSRRDLLELLLVQDKAANQAKDIAGLVTGRKMVFPEPIAEQLTGYVSRCEDACKQALKVINELDDLVETGFSGREVKLVASIIHDLDDIESDTDKLQIKIRATLLKIEKDLPPVDVMFFYKVIEGIGEVADISERIGSRVELLLAK